MTHNMPHDYFSDAKDFGEFRMDHLQRGAKGTVVVWCNDWLIDWLIGWLIDKQHKLTYFSLVIKFISDNLTVTVMHSRAYAVIYLFEYAGSSKTYNKTYTCRHIHIYINIKSKMRFKSFLSAEHIYWKAIRIQYLIIFIHHQHIMNENI